METIRVAFGSIKANPLRSFLTMLGMVIGVGAVITMVALGTGAQAAVEEQIQALGTDLLAVYPGQSRMHGVARGDRVSVTTDDAEALARDGYGIKAVVPELSRNQQLEYRNRNANVNVLASTPASPSRLPKAWRRECQVSRPSPLWRSIPASASALLKLFFNDEMGPAPPVNT